MCQHPHDPPLLMILRIAQILIFRRADLLTAMAVNEIVTVHRSLRLCGQIVSVVYRGWHGFCLSITRTLVVKLCDTRPVKLAPKAHKPCAEPSTESAAKT